MIALAQTSSSLALVAAFGLLALRQTGSATLTLSLQALAAIVAALASGHLLLAIPPLVVGTGVWLALPRLALPKLAVPRLALPKLPRAPHIIAPTGRSLATAAILTVLCLPLGAPAIPLAVVLLAMVLAASCPRATDQLLALAALPNALVLAASLAPAPAGLPAHPAATAWLATAAILLPLPFALPLLFPTIIRHRGGFTRRLGEIDITVALALALGSLAIPAGLVHLPLNPLAAIFAPLFGLDTVLRAWQRAPRRLPLSSRAVALAGSAATILAVCASDPVLAWIAVLVAITAGLLPTMARRRPDATVALFGAGIMLFGLIERATAATMGDFCVLAGAGMAAAIVPDLAAALAVLVLAQVSAATWPPAADLAVGGVALVGLAICATLLWQRRDQPASAHLLHLSHAALAILAISQGGANGRFAALILLILLVLTRSAARSSISGASENATPPIIASLAGLPPLGVFPGVALVVLVLAGHAAWLLVPVGLCLLPIFYVAIPRHVSLPSATDPAWIPLALALFLGYAAPDDFVRWCHALTMVAGP